MSDFDVLAFSVSFEWDYPNVVTMLRLAGLPPRAAERNQHHPLVLLVIPAVALWVWLARRSNARIARDAEEREQTGRHRKGGA